ncbi:LysR substrate-binding domain-containing protein [Solimonas marina]|uniref:LysR substrate-binding domain-containing protein n=1 Tax=Solimonas marina TaxID=2714601 RepID=UPI0019D202E3|nr:LysR substrate-binding domain-containing protein [Solimonas marina]
MAQPEDLSRHQCIGIRMGNGQLYHWELERGQDRVVFSADWSIVVNETITTIEIAETGGGIAYVLADRVARQLADGSLVQVLPEWSSIGPAFHLYYPSRRQLPQALRALLKLIQRRNE